MASQTPRRVVLGSLDVNVNTPSKRAVSPSSSPLKAAARPQISSQLVQTPSAVQAQQQGELAREGGLAGAKRGRDLGEDRELSPKKLRAGSDPEESPEEIGSESGRRGMGEGEERSEVFGGGLWSVDTMFHHSNHDELAPLSSSPRAALLSSPSTQGAMNESLDMNVTQDTIITEPDIPAVEVLVAAPSPPAPSPAVPVTMSQAQLRERAQALRLRLSLASYKIRTNQTDVPLSRLQVRSTSPRLPPRSFTRPKMGSSHVSRQVRQPIIPDIKIQRPSSKSQPSSDSDQHPPSSPPTFHVPYSILTAGQDISLPQDHKADDPEDQRQLVTPISPRKNEEMLDPRLRSPISKTEYPEKLTGSPAREQIAN
ncbi:hypothetical protein B7463_g3110, partial [Scytalidium lignicola]